TRRGAVRVGGHAGAIAQPVQRRRITRVDVPYGRLADGAVAGESRIEGLTMADVMRTVLTAIAYTTLVATSVLVAQQATNEQPTTRLSADVYLDGKAPWPKSPGRDVQLKDELGFAADRLFHVPAAGVHPRILFAPEDLP